MHMTNSKAMAVHLTWEKSRHYFKQHCGLFTAILLLREKKTSFPFSNVAIVGNWKTFHCKWHRVWWVTPSCITSIGKPTLPAGRMETELGQQVQTGPSQVELRRITGL